MSVLNLPDLPEQTPSGQTPSGRTAPEQTAPANATPGGFTAGGDTPGKGVQGTVLFTRYAFMPNHLERCGPLRSEDNRTIFEYAVAGDSDPYFTSLLREFQAAYPYLKLIAENAGLSDAFDPAVVEAYWLGSDLLERVEVREFYGNIEQRFGNKVSKKQLEYLLGKPPAGARPHHSFNVFDVQRFTQEKTHTLHHMEKCRIGWGRIVAVEPAHFVVEYQPLVWSNPASNGRSGLALGAAQMGQIMRHMDGKGFTDRAQVGDWLAFHWDWACDVITEAQRAQLEKWTRHHLRLANETL